MNVYISIIGLASASTPGLPCMRRWFLRGHRWYGHFPDWRPTGCSYTASSLVGSEGATGRWRHRLPGREGPRAGFWTGRRSGGDPWRSRIFQGSSNESHQQATGSATRVPCHLVACRSISYSGWESLYFGSATASKILYRLWLGAAACGLRLGPTAPTCCEFGAQGLWRRSATQVEHRPCLMQMQKDWRRPGGRANVWGLIECQMILGINGDEQFLEHVGTDMHWELFQAVLYWWKLEAEAGTKRTSKPLWLTVRNTSLHKYLWGFNRSKSHEVSSPRLRPAYL